LYIIRVIKIECAIPETDASTLHGAERTAYRECVNTLLNASLRVESTHHSHHANWVRNESSRDFLVWVADEFGIFAFKAPNGAWLLW
jgi:hypothetical protein